MGEHGKHRTLVSFFRLAKTDTKCRCAIAKLLNLKASRIRAGAKESYIVSALIAWCALALPSGAQERCRQALALGLDVSGSVDSREYRMQLDGLASAFQAPDVKDVLLSMPDAPIRIAVYEWSGAQDHFLLLPWTSVTDETRLTEIEQRLRRTQRTPSDQSTGLGSAMQFGARLLEQQSACWTQTLDISSDGKSNTGPHPKDLWDTPFPNITINALVIGADALDHGDNRQAQVGELSSYFEAYVLRGPTSFVEVALGFEDYEDAMIRKLKRELQGLMLTRQLPIQNH